MNLTFVRSPVLQILAGTLGSLASCYWSTWLIASGGEQPSTATVILVVLLYLASYILPAIVLALTLYRAFQSRRSWISQLRLILASYFSMIAVFAGVYFSMAFTGDHEYALFHYSYYRSGGEDLASGRIQHLNPVPQRPRAFVGMEERLWGTIDDYLPVGVIRDVEDLEERRARASLTFSYEEVVRFKSSAVLGVTLDCLHLSVITITTVGYGNIAPSVWYSKLAANIEALTGTILFVVALGMLFSGRTSGTLPI